MEDIINSEKYKDIRAHSIKVAQYYQDELNDLVKQYKSSREDSLLEDMYKILIKLNEIVFNFYSVYSIEAREWICERLATEVIMKYKERDDFEVNYWFKYLRLAILHIRDDYIQMEQSRGPSYENSGYEEDNKSDLVQDPLDLIYSMKDLFDSSYQDALSDMNEFLDIPQTHPLFYLRMLDIKLDHESYLSRLFDKFLMRRLYERVEKLSSKEVV